MINTYIPQDRGNKWEYDQYLSAMDAVAVEKVASASVFFEPQNGNHIVDIGMASGTSSAIMARLFPRQKITGIDINPKMVKLAAEKYQLPNLSFMQEDGETLSSFEKNSVNGFFNCSCIHHITSYNGYDSNRAISTLQRQTELLKENGVIVVRDFVKPEERTVVLELLRFERPNRPDDCTLFLNFAQTARSLAHPEEQGFPYKEIYMGKNRHARYFELFYSDAVEFIRRKDYYNNWDIELQEEYGYFTQQEFEDCFMRLGLRTIISAPVYNPWIIQNRYRSQVRIFDRDGNELGLPPTNYIIAGEKATGKGKSLHLLRHLPEAKTSYLHYSSFHHREQNMIYDVVERPEEVVDILPFFRNGNRIDILAKHGYPRPFANIACETPVIDNKKYSGYITEGITASRTSPVEKILDERFNLSPSSYSDIENSLKYYTSPGGIKEQVQSVFVRLKKSPDDSLPGNAGVSGFKESGFIRSYDAAQLLKTAQSGALAEARLEMNLYNLFRKEGLPLPSWAGEKIEIKKGYFKKASTVKELLQLKDDMYSPYPASGGYLRTYRCTFTEVGVTDSNSILEYALPSLFSQNTLVTLPVYYYAKEIYIGVEIRNLPVPQLYTGNSTLFCAPAKRLPRTIGTIHQMEEYIGRISFAGTTITRYFKLGEKYFSSIGTTTEQVYPYVVHLSEASDQFKWVKLSDLNNHLDKIKDGHLLINLFRLNHACGIPLPK